MKKIKVLSLFLVGLCSFCCFSYGEKSAVCEIVDVKPADAPVKNTKLNYDYSYKVGYFNMVGVPRNWTYTNTGGAMCFASESITQIYAFSIFFNGVQVGDEVGTWNTKWEFICYEGVGNWEVVNNTNNPNLNLIVLNDMTKNQCESFYDLVDSALYETCQSDLGTCELDLEECQSQECTGVEYTGELSTLYINDILHQSAPFINITIPEEFEWNYTGTNELFELDVVGYNTDTEYIAGIINTQKTTPNNQDFNNIITGLIPLLIPGFVIISFIYFVFRFVKKIF